MVISGCHTLCCISIIQSQKTREGSLPRLQQPVSFFTSSPLSQNIPRIRPTTEPDKHERQVPGFLKGHHCRDSVEVGDVGWARVLVVPGLKNDELLDFKIMNCWWFQPL